MVKKDFIIAIHNRNSGSAKVSSDRNRIKRNQRGRPSKEKNLQGWIDALSNCEISGFGLGLGNDILVKLHDSLPGMQDLAATNRM